MAIFDALNEEGRTIIIVTHEDEVADRAKRIVRLKDGMLHTDEPVSEERREAARARQKAAVEELKKTRMSFFRVVQLNTVNW